MNADTVADKLCEASIGPTQGQLDDIMRVIEEVMNAYVDIDTFEQEANKRMAEEGYPIRFDRRDELLNKNHAPGRVGEDAMVLMPPQIFGLEILRHVISHEGVHVFQMAAAERKGKAAEMFQSSDKRMMGPGGVYDRNAYYTDKHEVMAHARSLIDKYRAQRMNKRQALQQLRTDPSAGRIHREQRKRFLKNAYNYAQDLPEALKDRLPYLNAPEWLIKQAAALDPTGYKYVPWILKQLQKEAHPTEQQAIEGFTRKMLSAFDKLKKLPNFQGNKDINSYVSIYQLGHTLSLNGDLRSNRQAKADKAKEGEDVMGTDEAAGLRLVKFTNADAAMTFSHMTHLCTVGRKSADDYLAQGAGLYGVYLNDKPYVIICGGDWRTVDDVPITKDVWHKIKGMCRHFLGNPNLPNDVTPGPRPYWESADPDNADQIIKRLKVDNRCQHCRKNTLTLLTSEQARRSGLRSDIEIWQCNCCGRLANRPPVVAEAADPDELDPQRYIDSTPLHRIGRPKLDEFTRSYAACALWSSNDNSDPETGGEPMDRNYDIDDIEDETLWDMVDDCANFRQQHAGLLEQSELSDDRAGFCFWLSRNGHGSGFFDEGTVVDDELQEAAEVFGTVDLEVSDEGTIYAL